MFFLETREEAEGYIKAGTDNKGRGARLKVPKSLKYTPNEVKSAKKSQKRRIAVANEEKIIKSKRVSFNKENCGKFKI